MCSLLHKDKAWRKHASRKPANVNNLPIIQNHSCPLEHSRPATRLSLFKWKACKPLVPRTMLTYWFESALLHVYITAIKPVLVHHHSFSRYTVRACKQCIIYLKPSLKKSPAVQSQYLNTNYTKQKLVKISISGQRQAQKLQDTLTKRWPENKLMHNLKACREKGLYLVHKQGMNMSCPIVKDNCWK